MAIAGKICQHEKLLYSYLLSQRSRKPAKWHVRSAKTHTSLGIRPVWSESSLSAWRKLGSLATHWAHNEDSDQTGRIPSLLWVIAGCTCHFVRFIMRWLIYVHLSSRVRVVGIGACLFEQGWARKKKEKNNNKKTNKQKKQGPFVQSVVSLTSSLRVISLTVLADSIYNILIFFAEKKCEKLLTFFQQKISAYLRMTRCKF